MNDRENEKLQAGLRALAAGMKSEQAPPHLEVGLIVAYRRRRVQRIWRRGAVIGAVAASMAIIVAMVMREARHGTPIPPRPQVATVKSEPLQTPAAAAQRDLNPDKRETEIPGRNPRVPKSGRHLLAQTEHKQVRRETPPPARNTMPPPAEVVTGFLPVAGGDLIDPLDRGRMVRVRMPRSALRVFGLPMNEDRASEAVKADVVLGDDGVVRAIRFVQ